MYTLNFSEKERVELIGYYSTKLKDLERELLYCQNMLNKLQYSQQKESSTSSLKDGINNIVSDVELKDKSDNKTVPRQDWKKICLSSLKELNSFSSSSELYKHLLKKDSILIQYDKKDIISKISTALSNMYQKKTVYRIKNPNGRGYFWALPAWYSPELLNYYRKNLSTKIGVEEKNIEWK